MTDENQTATETPKKRGRGRPKGSKNKPKAESEKTTKKTTKKKTGKKKGSKKFDPKNLSDMHLVEALIAFRNRPLTDQQASPVWQELVEWMEDQFNVGSQTLLRQPGPAPQAMTTGEMPSSTPPPPPPPRVPGAVSWNGINIPGGPGPVFVPKLDGENPPPGPGWQARENGWFRPAQP